MTVVLWEDDRAELLAIFYYKRLATLTPVNKIITIMIINQTVQ